MGDEVFRNRVGEYIYELQLSHVAKISSKNYFVIRVDDKPMEICVLTGGGNTLAFSKDDGEKAYSLLQISYRNNGQISV